EDPAGFPRDWGEDRGAVSALITAGPLDEAGAAALRRVLHFARAAGAERGVFCHAFSRRGLTAAEIAGFARTLDGRAREAMDGGVRLSLHHHYDQPVMHREDFEVFFEAAPTGSIGLTLDTAHLVKSGIEDVAGVFRDFRRVIDNVHLKDYAD